MNESNNMLTFLAKTAMETVVKDIFINVYDMELTEDDIEFGFGVSMKIIKTGVDMGVVYDDYDNFHAMLFREAVCAIILSKKLKEQLEESK